MRLEGTGCGVWEAEQDGMGVCIKLTTLVWHSRCRHGVCVGIVG